MFYRSIPTLALVGLTACGGTSSDAPVVVPISSDGFATDTSQISGGDSFAVPNARRILETETGVLSAGTQDIALSIDSDGEKATVVIAGEPYVLDWQNNGFFALQDSTNIVEVFPLGDRYDEAEIVEVFAIIDDKLSTSHIVIGFDTDPVEVSAVSGTAEMNGQIFMTARNGFNDGFGGGPATLNVDFDAMTISGDFTLINRDLTNSDFAVPTTSYRFQEADIVGNGFAGDVALTSGDLEGTLTDATYEGRFYGQDAPSAGGQISATVILKDADQPTFIEGAFVATR